MLEHSIHLTKSHNRQLEDKSSEITDALQLDPPIHELLSKFDAKEKITTTKSSMVECVPRHSLPSIVKESIQYELKKLVIAHAVQQVSLLIKNFSVHG